MKLAKLWTNLSLRVKALAVVSLPVLSLIAAVPLIHSLEVTKEDTQRWIVRTLDVLTQYKQAYIAMISTESMVRDFATSGRDEGLLTLAQTGPYLATVSSTRSIASSRTDRLSLGRA